MYPEAFGQFRKQLHQLDTWLLAGALYAKDKSFDSSVLLEARLAPDQFALSRQVQIACDTVKLGLSRLTGKAAPSHADTEKTIDELRARVRSTLDYAESFVAADFAGTETRVVSNPRWEGKTMLGADYFLEHVLPNFYFHVTTAYAILRHNGVPVGKRDFLGPLTLR